VAPAKRRCLAIGHHGVVLDALRCLLEPEFEVRTTTADLDAALVAAATFRPDAAVIDLDAGDIGIGIARRLCEARPGMAVTYLTSETDPSWCPTAFSKCRPASELVQVVRAGMHRSATASTAERRQTPGQRGFTPAAILTDREREVLRLLVQGLTMKQVARDLGITPRTVAFHKYGAMAVNGLRNNADLMAFALRHGLLTLGSQQRS
jgi:DNA-binding NarL/FixJ family response regulator